MPITFKRAGQEAVTLENVSFNGVALDKVTFKRAGQEAVTVFENVTQDALTGTWVFNNTIDFPAGTTEWNLNFISDNMAYIAIRITAKFGGQITYINSSSGEASVYEAMWQYEANKTVTITSKLSEVTNGEQLLAWLQANATKQ